MAQIPQCVVDSLTPSELAAWNVAHAEGDDDPVDMPNIILRLCEVAARKDEAHQSLLEQSRIAFDRLTTTAGAGGA